MLLGGALGQPLPPRVQAEMNESIDRVFMGYRLYSTGKVRSIIISAGNLPWQASVSPESELIAGFYKELGLPEADLHQDRSSRNTHENALHARSLIDQLDCGKSLLVTSAFHMPRAMAVFTRAGIDVIPVSVDVALVHETGHGILDFLPDAGALNLTTLAIKEYLGMFVYRLQGMS